MMSDLISRSALQRTIKRSQAIMIDGNYYVRMHTVLGKLLASPDIDAVEVVHARWIHDINNLYGCSACLERETMSHKKMKRFCPNCGAKMDGGAEA